MMYNKQCPISPILNTKNCNTLNNRSLLFAPITIRRNIRTLCIPNIHETRKRLNTIFYACEPLSGRELRELVKYRRLQFSAVENGVELFVYLDKWEMPHENDLSVWDGMSDILNVWSAGDQIRNYAKQIKDNDITIIPIFIPSTILYDDDEYYHIMRGTSSF